MVVGEVVLRGPFYEVRVVPLRGGGWKVYDRNGLTSEWPSASDPYQARDLHLAARHPAGDALSVALDQAAPATPEGPGA